MKSINAYLISLVLLLTSSLTHAQNGDLSLNGIATFEQLRKEYYIGALYLGWPGHDQATITNMPGKKRMVIHITADRWPALRFAQMWNQAITINNPSAFINANALDILAFTSVPKGDLVEGDNLVIELATNNTTVVSLNGVTALRTNSPALFTMLLNGWIGARPPTSEFKRDILDLPKDQAAKDLVARFEGVRPNDARKKTIAGWGFKVESEAAAPAAAATVATVTAAATPAPTPTPTKKPEPEAKPAETPKAVAETKPAHETKPAETKPAEPKVAEAKPVPAPTPVVVAEPAKPVAPAQPDPAALAAKAARAKEQEDLNAEYTKVVRNKVLKNITYPKRAEKDNIEGLVMVRIKVGRDGGLGSVEVAQSADDLLDEEALRAVKKAAPFPKAPDALEGNSFESIVPIVFKLSQ
ncbi:MAG: TonB family protein [Spongiibacteraceae bacterium]